MEEVQLKAGMPENCCTTYNEKYTQKKKQQQQTNKQTNKQTKLTPTLHTLEQHNCHTYHALTGTPRKHYRYVRKQRLRITLHIMRA